MTTRSVGVLSRIFIQDLGLSIFSLEMGQPPTDPPPLLDLLPLDKNRFNVGRRHDRGNPSSICFAFAQRSFIWGRSVTRRPTL